MREEPVETSEVGILSSLDYTLELLTGIEDKMFFPTPTTDKQVSETSTKLSLAMAKIGVINTRLSEIKKELNKIG